MNERSLRFLWREMSREERKKKQTASYVQAREKPSTKNEDERKNVEMENDMKMIWCSKLFGFLCDALDVLTFFDADKFFNFPSTELVAHFTNLHRNCHKYHRYFLQEAPCYLRTVTGSFCSRTTNGQLDEGMADRRSRPEVRKSFKWSSSLWFESYRECSVVESVIFVAFEEVSVAVGILKRCVDVIRNSLPVADGFRVCRLDWRTLEWIETPEFAAFVEVNFAVSAPHHGGVDVVRHSGEALVNLFRVFAVQIAAVVSPVLWAFEEVSFAILVGERGIDVVGKSGPAFRDGFRVPVGDGVLRELVIFVTAERVRRAVAGVEDGIDFGLFAENVVVSDCRSFRRFSWRSRCTRSATAASTSWSSPVKCLNSLLEVFRFIKLSKLKGKVLQILLECRRSQVGRRDRILDKMEPWARFWHLNGSNLTNDQTRVLWRI